MFLLEHDAKALLALHGAPAPAGALLESADVGTAQLPTAPWVVKAQIAAGGRGKAGLIRTATTPDELNSHLRAILGATHKGMRVRACRIESQVTGAEETYLSFMLDPVTASVRVMLAAQGGVEIETLAATTGTLKSTLAAAEMTALTAAVDGLTQGLALHLARALNDAGRELARVFLAAELSLLEINPLFVRPDGSWTAGDAKIVTDDDAMFRQPHLRALLDGRATAYPEAHRKQHFGCDYVVVDPAGEIGLLTTGAGLSMMLIDELRARGLKPYNFLDVHTGGLRGDPARLVNVLNWIAEGPHVRVLFVNIFAGITDLGEFSRLLMEAFARVPSLKIPIVARLVGTNLDVAREFLAARGIAVEPDLEKALAHVRHHLAG
ncbi:MAG: ATP-grasp domain-containing protein [Burkholderiales bacterium]